MEIIVYTIVVVVCIYGVIEAIKNFNYKEKNNNINVIDENSFEAKEIIIKDKDKVIGKAFISRDIFCLFDIHNKKINTIGLSAIEISEVSQIFNLKEIDIKDFFFIRNDFKRHYEEKHKQNMTKLRYGIKGE